MLHDKNWLHTSKVGVQRVTTTNQRAFFAKPQSKHFKRRVAKNMQVGDMVRCTSANGKLGIVASTTRSVGNIWTASVLIDGVYRSFLFHQLQMVAQ